MERKSHQTVWTCMVKISQAQTPVESFQRGVPLSRVNTNPDDNEIYGLGIFWGFHIRSPSEFFYFDFCPGHSIIPVTWNPEYPPPPLVFLSLCCPIFCVAWKNSQHFATSPLVSTHKFNNDVSLPRSGWYLWLVMPQGKFIFFILKFANSLQGHCNSAWHPLLRARNSPSLAHAMREITTVIRDPLLFTNKAWVDVKYMK